MRAREWIRPSGFPASHVLFDSGDATPKHKRNGGVQQLGRWPLQLWIFFVLCTCNTGSCGQGRDTHPDASLPDGSDDSQDVTAAPASEWESVETPPWDGIQGLAIEGERLIVLTTTPHANHYLLSQDGTTWREDLKVPAVDYGASSPLQLIPDTGDGLMIAFDGFSFTDNHRIYLNTLEPKDTWRAPVSPVSQGATAIHLGVNDLLAGGLYVLVEDRHGNLHFGSYGLKHMEWLPGSPPAMLPEWCDRRVWRAGTVNCTSRFWTRAPAVG